MPMKSKTTCSVKGCANAPVKGRIFCKEHGDMHGVANVAYHRSWPSDVFIERKRNVTISTDKTASSKKGRPSAMFTIKPNTKT